MEPIFTSFQYDIYSVHSSVWLCSGVLPVSSEGGWLQLSFTLLTANMFLKQLCAAHSVLTRWETYISNISCPVVFVNPVLTVLYHTFTVCFACVYGQVCLSCVLPNRSPVTVAAPRAHRRTPHSDSSAELQQDGSGTLWSAEVWETVPCDAGLLWWIYSQHQIQRTQTDPHGQFTIRIRKISSLPFIWMFLENDTSSLFSKR